MDIEQNVQSIDENLTEEDLVDRLRNLSSEALEDIINFKRLDDPTLDEETRKLIDCPHEIIFTITAQALSQNEKGELTGTTEVGVKNYHIPVPIDKDYRHYMHIFFDYLENKILEAVDKSNTEAKDNKEESNDK